MDPVLDTIRDRTLTYAQKLIALAHHGEDRVRPLRLSPELERLRKLGVVCDLNEGPAPWRPRYIVPDYEAFLDRGSAFLGIEPPKDLIGAVFALTGLYRHVPSITGYPVWVGNLDGLLGRYVGHAGELAPEEERLVGLFMDEIDRGLPDSFCHGNLGPRANAVGRAILRHQRKAGRAIPNLTLRYDPELTDESFALEAISCALDAAKPSLANHRRFSEDFAALGLGDYAIASCYNGLPVGGGSLTLVRMNLAAIVAPGAPAHGLRDAEAFLKGPLAEAVNQTCDCIDERVRFIVEESGFFESSFLVREGLVSLSRFTAMFGLVGLAECVNSLLAGDGGARRRFGRDAEADELGLRIVAEIDRLVSLRPNPTLAAAGGRYLLHAQVGIDSDRGVSPGCRIPIGEEPPLPEHLLRSAPFHAPFVSGIGDVFAFEPTARSNPAQILDAARGFFSLGGRYFSAYAADSDLVRVTGYLVKRSEVEKLRRGEAVANGATVLGKGAFDNLGVLDRAKRP